MSRSDEVRGRRSQGDRDKGTSGEADGRQTGPSNRSDASVACLPFERIDNDSSEVLIFSLND